MMTAITRLIITIFLGWLGIHKFIDKKPLQGILYIFTFGLFAFGWIIDIVAAIQFCMKKRIDKIENTSKVLGIIFSDRSLQETSPTAQPFQSASGRLLR